MAQEQAELVRIRLQLHRVFTPNAPVSHKDSFQGRRNEIAKVIETVAHTGAHAAIFGERGVGKTSLAGLVHEFWVDVVKDSDILVARVNCEPLDDYLTIWAHVADDLSDRIKIESRPANENFIALVSRMRDGEADPSFVRRCFQAYKGPVVVVIDEFDRVQDQGTIKRFADTIKGLSDYAVEATLIIVGVADTIDQLIADHASVDRNLNQILLPRLAPDDIRDLVKSRYGSIGLGYEKGAIDLIVQLAQGLPYYAHLIGQSSGFAAIANNRKMVEIEDVFDGLEFATENAQESVKKSYYDAVSSTRNNSIHREVMLACALSPGDEFGYFTAADIRETLAKIVGHPVDMGRYLKYLSEFSEKSRGNILQREGKPWRQRYRFTNPLIETYVILKGLEEGLLHSKDLLP